MPSPLELLFRDSEREVKGLPCVDQSITTTQGFSMLTNYKTPITEYLLSREKTH